MEHLNLAGSDAAALSPPAKWHARPERVTQAVVTPAGMTDRHRHVGWYGLGLAAICLFIPCSWLYRIARTRTRHTTAP